MHSNVTTSLRLTGRSPSHFTRVVRMLAHELSIPLELEVVQDLMSLDAESYGGNPALKVPTLHIGEEALFGTDNICRRIAELAGRANDPRIVLSHQLSSSLARNAQELVWHAMTAQVQLLVGVRLAKLSPENVFFAKTEAGMRGSLGWLETRIEQVLAALPSSRDVSVFEISLFCLLEHIVFRPTLSLEAFPKLRAFATGFAPRESAICTPFCVDPAAAPNNPPATVRLPALDPSTLPPRTSSGYPALFRPRVTPREKRALGDAVGLTRFGVNLTTLFPGKESSLRHYHAREDEFVFVLEGEVTLRTDDGEQPLTAGMCAGFPAGSTNGHQLINRTDRPARYLEIGSRDPSDFVGYSDVDLECHKNAEGAWVYTRRDGSSY